MVRITKPRTLSLLQKVERRPTMNLLTVSVLGMFDLAHSDADRFQDEQTLWPLVAKAMPPGRVLDICMPKPTAEVLVGGVAMPPGGGEVERLLLEWQIGTISKRLLVTGDRWWQAQNGRFAPTSPVPFQMMPLVPQRAFGGQGHKRNPEGIGSEATKHVLAGKLAPLPNLETPEHAIRAIGDEPMPATFGPMALDSPDRLKYAGTYDARWAATIAPALPPDAHPNLFLFAPEDQRLHGFLSPGEPYMVRNFGGETEVLTGTLPAMRVRSFIVQSGQMVEIPLRIDTLWLFAGARRGIVIHRGAIQVADIEGADVSDIVLGYEPLSDAPRSSEHYAEVWRLRTDPATAMRHVFSEGQLAPPIRPEVQARRSEARLKAAADRKAARVAALQWLADREFAKTGLPAFLRQPMDFTQPSPADDLLLPLPEELASGEFDIGEMLDGIEAISKKAEADLEAFARDSEPRRDALAKITSGEAGQEDFDLLFGSGGMGPALADLDTSLAGIDIGEMPEAIRDNPDALEGWSQAEAGLASAKAWRQTIMDGFKLANDDPAQLSLARARFLGLPEGGPLNDARMALLEMRDRGVAPPPLNELPPEVRARLQEPPTPLPSLDELLASVADQPELPDAERAAMVAKLGESADALIEAMPVLAEGPGSPLTKLLDLLPKPTEPDYATLEEALAAVEPRVEKGLDEALQQLDVSQTRMLDAMAEMRRISPKAMKPDKPLTSAVASGFGEVVMAHWRSGGDLRERDLAGVDLSGVDLSGTDLSGAMLENAKLDGIRLVGANLAGATLAGASLVGADLGGADLTETILANADLSRAVLADARLIRTNLMSAVLTEAVFDRATLDEIFLLQADATGVSFQGASITGLMVMQSKFGASRWDGADLRKVQVIDTDFHGARFDGAVLHRVAIMKSRLPGARFDRCNFDQVVFVGEIDLNAASFMIVAANRLSFIDAQLADADFSRSTLTALCLVRAKLPRSRFRAAQMPRALLSRSGLQGADFVAANLMEAQLNRADLSGATLRFANLYGADLMDTTLTAADFSGANLMKTILGVARDVA